MSELSLANVINISLQGLPSGLSLPSVNRLALFTTEKPSNVDVYRDYLEAGSIATDYGTNALTTEMGNIIFSQSPNILSGGGSLVIIPLVDSVSATQGDFATADISANLAAIKAVTDGELRVTVDGTNVDLTLLDFSNISTFADVASILQKKLTNVIVDSSDTAFSFTSKKVGEDSDLVLAQLPAGTGTDLSGAGYFNTAGGTATSGANATGETIAEAITRVEDDVDFVGVITNLEMEDDIIESLATVIQARDNIFLHHFSSTADIAGIGSTIKDSSQDKTRCLLYTENPVESNLFKSAYASRLLSTDFSGSNTAGTMMLKEMSGIVPDPGMNQTIKNSADEAGMDMYVSFGGVPCVHSSGQNEYADVVYGSQALKFDLEVSGFNYLRQTNTKVPQTAEGMDGLNGAYRKVYARYVTNGVIGVGLEWNSSQTFGKPEVFKSNIREKGFYVYNVPIALQSQAGREARKAPLSQQAFKLAGAFHKSDVIAIFEQ